MKKDSVKITARVEKQYKTKLIKLAEQHERSQTWILEALIEYASTHKIKLTKKGSAE